MKVHIMADVTATYRIRNLRITSGLLATAASTERVRTIYELSTYKNVVR
jgi:hypothetical protein